MAFDAAASAVQPPPPAANASAKPADRKSDASDPFGALLAMLDGAQTETTPAAPATSPRPATEAAPANTDKADSPAPSDSGKDAPVNEADAPAASDPATLMAAMMVPAVVTPAPAATVSVAEAPAPAAPPVAAPVTPTAGDLVVPTLDLAPPAADAVPATAIAAETVPAEPTAPTLQTAEIKSPTPAAQAPQPQAAPAAQAALPADTEIPTPSAPAAAPDALAAAATPAAQPAPAAAPRQAANDKPADPTRADAAAVETEVAVAPRTGAHGEQDQHLGGDADGRKSDAEVTQQARADNPVASTAETASFAAAAPAAPEAPAPAVGLAQAAAPAPVIAAQAAAAPVRGMPETVAHLAAQMIQRLDGQTTRFDLTLNPQSLGRVDVRIEIGLKGALRARMAFDDAATAHEMSGRHTELRAALQNAGFDVPEGALSFDVASGGGGAFAERQDGDRASAPVFQNFADVADQDPAAVVKNYFSAAGSSGVDIRV